MSETLKRIMHPFTYKAPSAHNFKIHGIDTGMPPREFGRHLRKLMIKVGVNPLEYESRNYPTGWCKNAAEWWYAQQFDTEDELG